MTTSAERIRAYRGPALFSYGFRPFFLFGAVWAAVSVVLWLLVLTGTLPLPSHLTPVEWHVHELLYGYIPAIVAGFLLTAVPNWTGRLPVVGMRLAVLFAIWTAGRIILLVSEWTGAAVAVAVDLSFLAVLCAAVAREIISGKNARNLKVLVIVGLLFAGNLTFHLETLSGDPEYGTRMGIAATLFLIILIGGRIIPSFTRNWLARQAPGRLPEPFDRFDLAVMGVSGLALLTWIGLPDHVFTAVVMALAAFANLARLARWAGERTVSEPLVWILHLAYLFVPLGFALQALAIIVPDTIPTTAALHAWTAGAMATMTLAVMTRASLGHTGQTLKAGLATTAIYGAILVAALLRILAAFDSAPEAVLHIAATAWLLAFGGFAIVYGRMLLTRTPTKANAG